MQIFSALWNGLQEGLAAILHMYARLLEPIAGEYRWGLSIILLTLTVRLFLVPLAVRQTKSMRSMQQLQPELKKLQKKYEIDKSIMKTDPERYKAMKEKQREAQMALYQEHNVNPVGGCLPLILQMPIFFALFRVLQPGSGDPLIPELEGAGFFGIGSLTSTAAETLAVGAIGLVILQVATTYFSSKQMQGRNSNSGAEQQQAQKIMLYVMPAFLGYLSWTFPIGVVLYWVTTNFWTIGQQWVIFRNVEAQEAQAEEARKAARIEARARRRETGDGSGKSGPAKSSGSKSSGSKSSGSDADDSDSSSKKRSGGGSNGGKPRGQSRPGSSNGKANGTGQRGAKRAKSKPTE